MEDKWLSVYEITKYPGIMLDTDYKWINEKRMPAHKVGRLWKFRKEAIDKWIKSRSAGVSANH